MTSEVVPLDWAEPATRVVLALRERAVVLQGSISFEDALGAIIYDTPPGATLLGRLLRDPNVLRENRSMPAILGGNAFGAGAVSCHISDFEMAVERRAREAGVRRVGERHVAAELVARFEAHASLVGWQTGTFLERTNIAELGEALLLDDPGLWWHGVLDTNVILQCKDLHEISWREETGQQRVMLWMLGSVLRELDHLRHTSDSRRIVDRSRQFARRLAPQMGMAVAGNGIELRPGAYLRVWTPPMLAGMRDPDHLEGAHELQTRGIGVHVVTNDLAMQALGRAEGLKVHWPSERCDLPERPLRG